MSVGIHRNEAAAIGKEAPNEHGRAESDFLHDHVIGGLLRCVRKDSRPQFEGEGGPRDYFCDLAMRSKGKCRANSPAYLPHERGADLMCRRSRTTRSTRTWLSSFARSTLIMFSQRALGFGIASR